MTKRSPNTKFSRLSHKLRKCTLVILAGVLLYMFGLPLYIHHRWSHFVYKNPSDIPHQRIAMILGAGVAPDGTPRDMLRDRLDTASDLYHDGKIEKILVTGDNRVSHYNEPLAMTNYLVNTKHIPSEDIVQDYAGRRTYDSCARARRIFEIDRLLIISQGYHLPRSIMLCNSFGIDSTGISATQHDYVGMWYYKLREVWAIHKSILDLYIWAPEYVGGDKIAIKK